VQSGESGDLGECEAIVITTLLAPRAAISPAARHCSPSRLRTAPTSAAIANCTFAQASRHSIASQRDERRAQAPGISSGGERAATAAAILE